MKFAILTISDRSSRGEREDLSGPLIAKILERQGWQIELQTIVSDDQPEIEDILLEWADVNRVDVILTTGGTGFAPRDRTPEATRSVIDQSTPGLVEAMRAESLKKTPHAMLSRAAAGIRGSTLIVNLPGSPRAVRENLEVILPVLSHAVQLIKNDPHAEAGHIPEKKGNA